MNMIAGMPPRTLREAVLGHRVRYMVHLALDDPLMQAFIRAGEVTG